MAVRTVILPQRASLGPRSELRDLLDHRDLLLLLVRKDLRAKYKGTALGFLWSLLNPLLMMAVYALVYSFLFRFSMPRYPIFLLSGLLAWNAFSATITAGAGSVLLNGTLVKRVRFPVELLPLTSSLSAIVNFLLSLLVLVLFAGIYRQPLGWSLVALPAILVLQTLWATGLALMLSAVMVYFRDVEYLVQVALAIWFFATPVIYPLAIVQHSHHERIAALIQANPMTWFIESYQRIWHDDLWPVGWQMLAMTCVAILSLVLGRLVFRRLQRRFAEEV